MGTLGIFGGMTHPRENDNMRQREFRRLTLVVLAALFAATALPAASEARKPIRTMGTCKQDALSTYQKARANCIAAKKGNSCIDVALDQYWKSYDQCTIPAAELPPKKGANQPRKREPITSQPSKTTVSPN